MSTAALFRWGGVALVGTAATFLVGGILVIVIPGGGLTHPAAAIAYYVGTALAVPALTALYAAARQQIGRLGFAGYTLGTLGAVIYSGPQLALVAGLLGGAGWHDVWGVAMGRFPMLLIGPPAFFLGMVLLGTAAFRGGVAWRIPAMLLAAGALLWFIVYFLAFPGGLTAASLLTAAALGWSGLSIFARTAVEGRQPQAAIS